MNNIKLPNGKYIVIVDVGSTVAYNHVVKNEVKVIDIENKLIHSNNGYLINFDRLLDIKNSFLYSINGVETKDIEEIRIAGYNNTVTLKVGDKLILESWYKARGYDSECIISRFNYIESLDKIVPDNYNFDGRNDGMTIWYVNHKPYYEKDIIIPTESEKVEEVKTMEITKDNITAVLVHNGFTIKQRRGFEEIETALGDKCIILNTKDIGFKYFAYLEEFGGIKTNDFDEFLAFVQKRIDLKPLPKEKSLEDKLIEAKFELDSKSSFCKEFKRNNLSTCIYKNRIIISHMADRNCVEYCTFSAKPHEHDLVFKHIAHLEECYGDKK